MAFEDWMCCDIEGARQLLAVVEQEADTWKARLEWAEEQARARAISDRAVVTRLLQCCRVQALAVNRVSVAISCLETGQGEPDVLKALRAVLHDRRRAGHAWCEAQRMTSQASESGASA